MNSARSSAGLLTELARRAGLKAGDFAVPVALSLGAAAAECYNLALLFPTIAAALSGDFAAIHEARAFRLAAMALPALSAVEGRSLFFALLALIFASTLVKNALTYGSDRLACRLGARFADGLRRAIFARLMAAGKAFFDATNAGRLQNALLGYVESTAERVVAAQEALGWAFTLAAYLVVLSWISWRLTLLVALVYPFLHGFQRQLLRRIKASSGEYAEAAGELGAHLHNVLSSIILIKSYAAEKAEIADFDRRSGRLADVDYAGERRRVMARPAQEIIFTATILLLLAGIAHWGGPGGVFGPRLLVFFYTLRRSATVFGAISNFAASAARVHEPMSELADLLGPGGPAPVPDGTREFPGLRSRVSFVDARFSYAGDREALKGLTFSAEKGKVTAIVGPSGAGKSTLASLLLRFYDPASGAILLDGDDLRSFAAASVRRRTAFVTQETALFHDTLRRNVCYGLGEVPEDRIWDALRRARLEEFARLLPQGLETVLGDRGVQLSGGERQRLSIARALLKDPEFLILDEATSALDSETERRVQESIRELVRGRTALVIAHRLSTVRDADRIVVVVDGRVAESGTREELLGRDGLFKRYWEAQKFE